MFVMCSSTCYVVTFLCESISKLKMNGSFLINEYRLVEYKFSQLQIMILLS